MGTISSSVGLISGMDISAVVKQLMDIERRPLNLLTNRIKETTQIQQVFTELNARILASQVSMNALARPTAFTIKKATSSNEQALTAKANDLAALGTYSFTVKSLVTTHQIVSTGFADRDSTPIGAGDLTFKIGNGSVSRNTALDTLNGGDGIRRGVIRITDRSGAMAEVDLRGATSVNEVLEAINSQSTARVVARIEGDRIVVEDQTGLATGSLTISDTVGGGAAADLGLAGASATGTLTSKDLIGLTAATALSQLNDGTGFRYSTTGDDLEVTLKDGSNYKIDFTSHLSFTTHLNELNDGRGVRAATPEGGGSPQRIIRITNHAGESAEIDLTSATTIQDVNTAIAAAGLQVTVGTSGGKLSITDSSTGDGPLKIEDVVGYAAQDLGIKSETTEKILTGSAIYRFDTLGAALRRIQYATGGKLTATISPDGDHVQLIDNTNGSNPTTLAAIGDSLALRDLGLTAGDHAGATVESRRLLAGLNTVLLSSLNGGNGVRAGTINFTRRDGSSVQLDFSGAQSLNDVVSIINNSNQNLTAQINSGGTGIIIKDSTNGTGALSATGTMAEDLNLTGTADGNLGSGDLHLQFISENTKLSTLNLGAGISYGKFSITNSAGVSTLINLAETTHTTVGDVIKSINDANAGVTARINDTGDGILIEDTAGGSGKLAIHENGTGTVAASLGIKGTATTTRIDGSFTRTISLDSDDTLDEVMKKINDAKVGVNASVINDGTSTAPYRLIISSSVSGTKGQIAFDTGTTGLKFNPLTEAKDAKVVVGDPSSPNAIIVTGSSNTINNIVEGVSLTLTGISEGPVTVNVTRDIDQVVANMKSFVEAFNGVMDRISQLTRYNAETQERGILLGNNTVLSIQSRMMSVVSSSVRVQGLNLSHPSQVGISIGQGAMLQFDEAAFRAAFEKDPEAVKKLFTHTEERDKKVVPIGMAARLKEQLEQITTSAGGTIKTETDAIAERLELFNRRATHMEELLSKKEQRLYKQFQAMETALAEMQRQQSALAGLQQAITAMRPS